MGHIRGEDGGTGPAFPAAGIPALLVMIPRGLGDDDVLGSACRAGEPDHIPGTGAINFWILFSFSHCWIPGMLSCGANRQVASLPTMHRCKNGFILDMVWPAGFFSAVI